MFQTTLKDPKVVGIRVWKAQDLRTDFSSSKKHKKHTTKWQVVYIGGSKKKFSEVVDDPNGNPVWNHEVNLKLMNRHEPLSILIVDSENNHAGQVIIPLTQLNSVGPHSQYQAFNSVEMENDPSLKVDCLDITKKNNSPKGRLYFWAWVKEYREDSLEDSARLDAKRSSGSVLHLPTKRDLKQLFHSTHHLGLDDSSELSSSIDNQPHKSIGKKIRAKFKIDKRGESVPDTKMREIMASSSFTLSDALNRRSTYAPDMCFEDDPIADSLSEYSGSVRSSNISDYLSRYDSMKSSEATAASDRVHNLQNYYHPEATTPSETVKPHQLDDITPLRSPEKTADHQWENHVDNSSTSSIGSFRAIGARSQSKTEESTMNKRSPLPVAFCPPLNNNESAVDPRYGANPPSNSNRSQIDQHSESNGRHIYPDSGIGLQGDDRVSSPALSSSSFPPPTYPPPVPPPRLSQPPEDEEEISRVNSPKFSDSKSSSRQSDKCESSIGKIDNILNENKNLKETLEEKWECIRELEDRNFTLQTELTNRGNDVDRLAKQLCDLQSRLMLDGLFQYLEH